MLACTPPPGLGTIAIQRSAIVRVVDLATCRTTTERPAKPTGGPSVVVHRSGKSGTQSIVFRGRTVLTVHESYARILGGTPGPIELFGTTPDHRWVLYAIDPMNSASLAADGLTLEAVSVATGRKRIVAAGLLADDYRAWCGGRLVMTAGGDRIATHNKRLIVTGPPAWHTRLLVRAASRAFGSLACAPDAKSVIVLSQPATGLNDNVRSSWSLWRVGLNGAQLRLTSPPRGYSDDAPRVSPDGRTIYFVRSRRNIGELYALQAGKRFGPLLALGAGGNYYGHRQWPYSVRR